MSRSSPAARFSRHHVTYAIGARPTRALNRRTSVGRETPASAARRSFVQGAAGSEWTARNAAAVTGSPSAPGQDPQVASAIQARIM
ncbi:hypothetical protein GCM10009559_21540 [Pseudonocardia zijingensis]|uniref:Uncharacterized protein n=1 Tax=Pseudonocardia zijingensis TaxID=153376 RepID=A0ABP4A717_9PSEU